MIRSQLFHPLRLGGAIALGGAVLVSIVLLRNPASEAFSGMPADQQTYWSWVALINQDTTSALRVGEQLLQTQPDLPQLYQRYATLCAETDSLATCQQVLAGATPMLPLPQTYQQAAALELASYENDVTADWKALAASKHLDPTLTRRIVDEARRDRENEWLEPLETQWLERYAADSSEAAIAFGLGYIAIQFRDWDAAEPMLKRATVLAPNDAQAYRELGRIYFFTGQPDAFNEALTAGIQAASNSYDLEQEVVMSGNLGLAYVRSGDFEQAEQLYQEALRQAKAIGQDRSVGFNQYRLAEVYARQHRYDEALVLLDSAEVHYEKHAARRTPEVTALRGQVLRSLFRFSDAQIVLEQTRTAAQQTRNLQAEIQSSVAFTQLLYQMGHYSAALETGLEALTLARTYRQRESEIGALIVLGDVERLSGNYEKSEAHYLEGLAIAEEGGYTARLIEMRKRLADNALSVLDVEQAEQHLNNAIQAIEAQESDPIAAAYAYRGLGDVYSNYQNDEEALRLYNLALEQLSESQDNSLKASLLVMKAYVLTRNDAYAEAQQILDEATELAGANESNLYEVERAYANLMLDQGDFEQARQAFAPLVQAVHDQQRNAENWDVLLGLAVAQWQLGQHEQAEASFLETIEFIETLRDNLDSRLGRSFYVQNKALAYEYYAAFLESQDRAAEAFHVTERGRSRSLVDLLYTTQKEQQVDENELGQAIEMRRRINALAVELNTVESEFTDDAQRVRGTRAAYLRREFRRADSLYRQAEVNLTDRNRLYTFAPVQADSVRDILLDNEALVLFNIRELTIGPEATGEVIAYIILPDTVISHRLQVDPQQLTQRVRFFRAQLSSTNGSPGANWEATAQRLYADLVAPLTETLPVPVQHLHIIPEGILHYLPFAALQNADGRFLIEDYTLSVAPSASILKLCRARNERRWSSMLLIADPNERLPGAREEALAIAGESSRRLALIGDQATQSNFEDLASNYDILHFATHGNFVARSPWRSHLEMYEDDVLSVAEIGNLRLDDAYLVTLSACETALSSGVSSDIPNGDEWVGFNQAFLAAGTPTVMASLWPIDDAVSSSFMIGFYEALGIDGKAEALATIQRQFIQNPNTSHPFYWAAFSVIGDPL